MFKEKNQRGNTVIYQSPSKKHCWGFVDADGDYISTRDFKRGQIFRHFRNAVAIQLEILDWLEGAFKLNNIRVRIENYDKQNFWAVCPIADFRAKAYKAFGNKCIFSYDSKYGKQIMLPMGDFVWEHDYQKKLTTSE